MTISPDTKNADISKAKRVKGQGPSKDYMTVTFILYPVDGLEGIQDLCRSPESVQKEMGDNYSIPDLAEHARSAGNWDCETNWLGWQGWTYQLEEDDDERMALKLVGLDVSIPEGVAMVELLNECPIRRLVMPPVIADSIRFEACRALVSALAIPTLCELRVTGALTLSLLPYIGGAIKRCPELIGLGVSVTTGDCPINTEAHVEFFSALASRGETLLGLTFVSDCPLGRPELQALSECLRALTSLKVLSLELIGLATFALATEIDRVGFYDAIPSGVKNLTLKMPLEGEKLALSLKTRQNLAALRLKFDAMLPDFQGDEEEDQEDEGEDESEIEGDDENDRASRGQSGHNNDGGVCLLPGSTAYQAQTNPATQYAPFLDAATFPKGFVSLWLFPAPMPFDIVSSVRALVERTPTMRELGCLLDFTGESDSDLGQKLCRSLRKTGITGLDTLYLPGGVNEKTARWLTENEELDTRVRWTTFRARFHVRILLRIKTPTVGPGSPSGPKAFSSLPTEIRRHIAKFCSEDPWALSHKQWATVFDWAMEPIEVGQTEEAWGEALTEWGFSKGLEQFELNPGDDLKLIRRALSEPDGEESDDTKSDSDDNIEDENDEYRNYNRNDEHSNGHENDEHNNESETVEQHNDNHSAGDATSQ